VKRKPKGKPRVSTTDPDARVMPFGSAQGEMGDGGFGPATNIQFGVDTPERSRRAAARSSAWR
jgi:hypothetical protein